jgi:hypothetical protein
MTVDVPNKNDRIYPRAVMEAALANLPQPFFIQRKQAEDGVPLLADCVGEVKGAALEGNKLVIDCVFTDADVEAQITAGKLHVVPAGVGMIETDKTISDYALVYTFLTDDPA